MEKKYQILPNDTIQVKHPGQRNKIIKLYRIIALRDLHIKIDKEFFATLNKDNAYLDRLPDEITIPKMTIGGYVESEFNLDLEDESWIGNNCKVFGNTKITSDSYIYDEAVLFGNITIEKSVIGDKARIQNGFGRYFQELPLETILIHHSLVLDKSLINEKIVLYDSVLRNSSRIYGESTVHKSYLEAGAYIFQSTVRDAKLFDCACIQVSNSNGVSLGNRSTITNNQRTDFTQELQIISEEIK